MGGLRLLFVLLVFWVMVSPTQAQWFSPPAEHVNRLDERFAIGGGVSTAGFTVQPKFKVSDSLVLRGVGNWLRMDESDRYDGVDYDVEMELLSGGINFDWHPFRSGFHVTAGAFYNGNGIDLTGNPTANVTIGANQYSPAQVGTLHGELETNRFSPYVGLGYDDTFFGGEQFNFWVEVGAFFHGSPALSLRSTGALANNAAFQADLEAERRSVEEDFDIPIYPVVGLGFSWRF